MRVSFLTVPVALLFVQIVFATVISVDDNSLLQTSSTADLTGLQNVTTAITGTEVYTLRETCDEGKKHVRI